MSSLTASPDRSRFAVCRSFLFVPATSESMVRKALDRGADFIIADLEDSVHPNSKDASRSIVARLLAESAEWAAKTLVRVNSATTPWAEDDLDMVASGRPAGVVLPKADTPDPVAWVDEKLSATVALFPLVESAEAVMNAPRLARCCPSVVGLIFGAADYRASMNARASRSERELLYARNRILHAARAHGRVALDSPWFDLEDRQGLERSCRSARGLGFDGKTAIHPSQIEPIHRAFSPTAAELRRARRVVETFASVLRRGGAVATLDGELIEELHARQARALLDAGRRLGIEF